MTEPLHLDPAALAGVATSVRRTGASLLADVTALASAIGPRPGPDGWPVTAALRNALDVTVRQLTGSADDLRDVGSGLLSSVGVYQATDQRVRQRFEALPW